MHEELSERRGILILEGDREAWPEHDPRRVRQRALLHLDVYWIVTLLPDGTQHIGSPFAITALDALYNASWGT